MSQNKNRFLKFACALVLASQLALVGQFVLIPPKKVDAFWGIADFNFSTTMGSPYDVAVRMGKAALLKIAVNYANQYLTRFLEQAINKYKIRNYLYYDQVLSDYYLTRYVYEKVKDPDLRQIYTLMNRTYVTGQPTGLTGSGINPNDALLPRLRTAIDKYYVTKGGVNPDIIAQGRPANMTPLDYFEIAQAFSLNPPSFTENQLNAEFGKMIAQAEAATQQEIAAGNGYKASHTSIAQMIGDAAGNSLAGDVITAAIENPPAFVRDFTTAAVGELLNINFNNANSDLFSNVGSLLGNFIFRKLTLMGSSTNDVLNETSYVYQAGSDVPQYKEIDQDHDGFPEGQDTDSDGVLEVCFHGGTAPNCNQSSKVQSSAYFTPLCEDLERSITALTGYLAFIQAHSDQIIGYHIGITGISSGGTDFHDDADADLWSRRTMQVLSTIDTLLGNVNNYNNPNLDNLEISLGRYSSYMNNVNTSLIKDSDLDLGGMFSNGKGGGLDGLIKNSQAMLDYLKNIKTSLNRCDNPVVENAANVPVPPIDNVNPGSGSSGGDQPPADAYTRHPDQSGAVAAAKSSLEAAGYNLLSSGPLGECGAWLIANQAAWNIGNGAGILTKDSGNRCIVNGQGYSVDIIVYPDGYIYDVVGASGTQNNPTWGAGAPVDPARWRAPLDPAGYSNYSIQWGH